MFICLLVSAIICQSHEYPLKYLRIFITSTCYRDIKMSSLTEAKEKQSETEFF